MHMPRLMQVESDFGITGRTKYRRQSITGKMILVVEVILEKKTSQGPRVFEKVYSTYWRDATMEEAIQIATGIAHIPVPENYHNPKGDVVRPAAPPSPPPGYRRPS